MPESSNKGDKKTFDLEAPGPFCSRKRSFCFCSRAQWVRGVELGPGAASVGLGPGRAELFCTSATALSLLRDKLPQTVAQNNHLIFRLQREVKNWAGLSQPLLLHMGPVRVTWVYSAGGKPAVEGLRWLHPQLVPGGDT